jgi:hypothetical protein
MPHGVHPAVDDMQPLFLHSVSDCAPSHAGIEKLPPGDHAMLALCKARDQLIDATMLRLGPYFGPNCRSVCHGRQPGAHIRAWGARRLQVST